MTVTPVAKLPARTHAIKLAGELTKQLPEAERQGVSIYRAVGELTADSCDLPPRSPGDLSR